jgi:hypothetical protein
MISTALANAMALLKSHLPNLDVELLCKNFMVGKAEREVLTSGAYDAAHLHHPMIFPAFLSPKTMIVLGTYSSSHVCCNKTY